MKASNLIAAYVSVTENSIILIPKAVDWNAIALLGTTLPTSVKNRDIVEWLTIKAPDKGKKGLIAVRLTNVGSKDRTPDKHFFLVISNEEKPYIDLENPWVPPGDRLGQISSSSYITISIGETIYCNSRFELKGYKRVPDGNLLCRYLMGEVISDEVIKAAEQQEKEKNEVDELKERAKDLEKQWQELWEKLGLWHWLADQLRLACLIEWRHPLQRIRAIRSALKAFPVPATIIGKRTISSGIDYKCFICKTEEADHEATCVNENGSGAHIRCCSNPDCQIMAALWAFTSPWIEPNSSESD